MKPDIELIRQWFSYNPKTGTIIRLIKNSTSHWDIVPLDKRLYFLGKRYPYSHIVWVLYHGKWPAEYIDHRNHDQLDFRIENLREATPSQNQHNKRMNNPCKGVVFDGSVLRKKPWIARIMVNNKSIFLGSFETCEEAAVVYKEAAAKYHGEFACYD